MSADGLHHSWTGQEPADVEVARLRSELEEAQATIAEVEADARESLDMYFRSRQRAGGYINQIVEERANSDRLAGAAAELERFHRLPFEAWDRDWTDAMGNLCRALDAHRALRTRLRSAIDRWKPELARRASTEGDPTP